MAAPSVGAAPRAGMTDSPTAARVRRVGARGVLYAVASFFALFAALPFAWMVLTIFKQDADLYNRRNNPFLYNKPPTWKNIDPGRCPSPRCGVRAPRPCTRCAARS